MNDHVDGTDVRFCPHCGIELSDHGSECGKRISALVAWLARVAEEGNRPAPPGTPVRATAKVERSASVVSDPDVPGLPAPDSLPTPKDEGRREMEALRAEVGIVRADAERLLEMVDDRCAEVERLKSAIRTHRDKCNDDRCWVDDHVLYSALGEPFETHTKNLPCREEFLASCGRYWEQRQPTGAPITEHPPDPEDMSDPGTLTIGQLEREVERLKAEIERLNKIEGPYNLLMNQIGPIMKARQNDWRETHRLEIERDGLLCQLAEAKDRIADLGRERDEARRERDVLLDVLEVVADQIGYIQESYGTDGLPDSLANRIRDVIAQVKEVKP